ACWWKCPSESAPLKRLTLMRHADARWKDPGVSDVDRPLSRRGTTAAEAVARRLLELELVPDLLIASPARRTQQTAEIVARELPLPTRLLGRESCRCRRGSWCARSRCTWQAPPTCCAWCTAAGRASRTCSSSGTTRDCR